MHPSNLNLCLYKKICARVDQIVDPSNSLREFDETHCRELTESFRSHNYDSVLCMITVYFCSIVNHEGATQATSVHNFDDINLLNDFYWRVMLNGHNLRLWLPAGF